MATVTFNCLLLSVATVVGLTFAQFPSDVLFQEPEHLFCNCTVGSSKLCSDSGVCDAQVVARELRDTILSTRGFMKILSEFPGDGPKKVFRDSMCRQLSSNPNVTDLLLLDFVDSNWKPACIRYQEGSEETQGCSIAPANFPRDHFEMTKDEINAKTRKLFEYLECSKDTKIPLLRENVQFCRYGNFCNTDEITTTSTTTTTHVPVYIVEENTVEFGASNSSSLNSTDASNRDAYDAESNLFLIIMIPCVVILLLILIVVTALVCCHTRAWKFVYKITEQDAENENVKNRLNPERLSFGV